MTLDEIKALIAAMGASDLAGMEVVKDGWTLRLSRHCAMTAQPAAAAPATRPATPAPAAAQPATPAEPAERVVSAPLSGIVYLAPSPGAASFVSVGQTIEAGAILCMVEAMKTFNEVRAEASGVVAAVLVETGAEIEAGQTLMRIA